ncbi:MAG: hypothetical protein AAFY65_15950 [Pseudomonadota bacterium]
MTPFDIWAPIIRAPFSGDVTQEIVPRVLSPEIQGVPEIEHRVQTEVASYGQQLDILIGALRTLSDATKTPLPQVEHLYQQVEAVKADSKAAYRAQAEAALAKLRAVDEDGWRALRRAD